MYCFSNFTIGKDGGDIIDKEVMFRLLDESLNLGINSFHFTGGGEPFCHPDIYDILGKVVANNFEFGMVTNGSLMAPFDRYNLDIFNRMSWIRISVDASDADMYYKLRKVNGFKNLIKSIDFFSHYCPDTILGLSFVINPTNYRQIVDFAKLGKKLGVDNVRFSIAWMPRNGSKYEFIMYRINRYLSEAKELETPNYKIFDLIRGRLENFELKDIEYSSCGYQHFTSVIGADGNVYPCCTLKYNPKSCFGNIKEQSFDDIWNGSRRKEWLKSNYLVNICSKNICWMQDKNKFIGYLLNNNPKHVNFI